MGENRVSIKTSKKEIVDYWFSRIDESNLSVDGSEAEELCWRCGCKRELERCHIIADSLGGLDEPSNLVLLCKRCHIDNPNVNDSNIMWDWLYAYKTTFYDTFWILQGMKEYEFIYKRTVAEDLKICGEFDQNKFNDLLKEEIKKTTYHFGHPYLNSATIAGTIRIVINKMMLENK